MPSIGPGWCPARFNAVCRKQTSCTPSPSSRVSNVAVRLRRSNDTWPLRKQVPSNVLSTRFISRRCNTSRAGSVTSFAKAEMTNGSSSDLSVNPIQPSPCVFKLPWTKRTRSNPTSKATAARYCESCGVADDRPMQNTSGPRWTSRAPAANSNAKLVSGRLRRSCESSKSCC